MKPLAHRGGCRKSPRVLRMSTPVAPFTWRMPGNVEECWSSVLPLVALIHCCGHDWRPSWARGVILPPVVVATLYFFFFSSSLVASLWALLTAEQGSGGYFTASFVPTFGAFFFFLLFFLSSSSSSCVLVIGIDTSDGRAGLGGLFYRQRCKHLLLLFLGCLLLLYVVHCINR